MFWAGTVNSLIAARKLTQSAAVLSAKIASAVRAGSSAVQRSATPYPGDAFSAFSASAPSPPTGASAPIRRRSFARSDRSGPCRVLRTVILTGSPPATLIFSVRRSSLTCRPSRSYCSPFTRSRYRSTTSGPRLVKPQAIFALCPITTPGSPENEYPLTSNGHSAVTSVQCSPTWYQVDGAAGPRCGSLASSGLPVFVRLPASTHEFDPIPWPFGPSSVGMAPSPSRTARSTVATSVPTGSSAAPPAEPVPGAAGDGAPTSSDVDAAASNTPLRTPPVPRIGACRCSGYGGYSSSTCSRVSPEASSSARPSSSAMLLRRSHAIALSQATLSTGFHFSIRYPGFRSFSRPYSRLASTPE